MSMSLTSQCEVNERMGVICASCGQRQGEIDVDGLPVRVEEFQGELLCADCHEVLEDVKRWV